MPTLDVTDLRIAEGDRPDLGVRDRTRDKLGLEDKDAGKALLADLHDRMFDLQRELWAEDERSVLVVLQGMDTSGKDGTIRRAFGAMNPQGVTVTSFGKPSDRELDRDYLWRVHAGVPPRGNVGLFNRSHYEDVGIVRVNGWIDEETVQERFRQIRDFERMLAENGTVIRKCFLDISPDEQRERLQERIDRPEKHWKFNLGDLDVREQWPDYMDAYSEAVAATSTEWAPWYRIPADRKWVRDVAAAQLLVDTLEGMDLQTPDPDPELDGLVVPALDD